MRVLLRPSTGCFTADGVVYATAGQSVDALNASTGALLWTFATRDNSGSSPAVANGVVYVGANFGTLYALDATSGAQLWSAHLIHYGNSPAVANGVVYVTSNQELYALNARTGAKLWVYKNNPVSDFLVYPAVLNGMLYVGDSSYYQLAFGLK